MSFVYHSLSLVGLLLNATLVICGAVIVFLLVLAEQGVRKKWMTPIGIGLAILGVLIIILGDDFSAYL